MDHAFWGSDYSQEQILEYLQRAGIPHEHVEDDERCLDRVVDYLQDGKVCGW